MPERCHLLKHIIGRHLRQQISAWLPFFRDKGKYADPELTPQSVTSDLDLQCLLPAYQVGVDTERIHCPVQQILAHITYVYRPQLNMHSDVTYPTALEV